MVIVFSGGLNVEIVYACNACFFLFFVLRLWGDFVRNQRYGRIRATLCSLRIEF